MSDELSLAVTPSHSLEPGLLAEVHSLCNRAYQEDLGYLFSTFGDATHVLGFIGGRLISHAMWVTRWLQVGDGPLLRTAYVEMVATDPDYQRRGYATAVMHHLASAITDFDLGGLSPADTGLYSRLGWEFWRGPLSIRAADGLWHEYHLLPTPEEQVMVLRLPKTPPLDLELPLSAEWREGEVW